MVGWVRGGGSTVPILVEEAEGLLELSDLVVGELVHHWLRVSQVGRKEGGDANGRWSESGCRRRRLGWLGRQLGHVPIPSGPTAPAPCARRCGHPAPGRAPEQVVVLLPDTLAVAGERVRAEERGVAQDLTRWREERGWRRQWGNGRVRVRVCGFCRPLANLYDRLATLDQRMDGPDQF
jgi:hypothetical protein